MGYWLELRFPPDRLAQCDRENLTRMLVQHGVQLVDDPDYEEPVLLAPSGNRIWLSRSDQRERLARGAWGDVRFSGSPGEIEAWLDFAGQIGESIHDPQLGQLLSRENQTAALAGCRRIDERMGGLAGRVRNADSDDQA